MAYGGANMNGAIDRLAVRNALRAELESRGHIVASDTLGMRGELYIVGANDLAKALFHFGTDAGDAAESLYTSSGSWTAGMPPRFAVLPIDQAHSPSLEMLEQMRTRPVFYEMSGATVAFRGLDQAISELADA